MILTDRLHKYFESEFNLSEVDSAKLKYSLEIIIGDFSKLLILFILFSILGSGTDFIYSSLALLMIRLFTGGLHFKTYAGCIIFSGIFFYTSIFLKTHIPLNFKIAIILFIFSLVTVNLFAPICGKSRPTYSHRKRQQFKLASTILMFIHFSLYFFTDKNPYFTNSVWVITLQAFQILIAKGVMIYENHKFNFEKTI